MILRNLRTEVARIEKANADLIAYSKRLEGELVQLRQQKLIDEVITPIGPINLARHPLFNSEKSEVSSDN